MRVSILGTEYMIESHKVSEDTVLKDNRWCGYCAEEQKKIVIADMTETEFFANLNKSEQEIYKKRTLRHEILHAFLNESGLSEDAFTPSNSWAKNEEMIDWFAIQAPKIFAVYNEIDCL